MLLQVAALAVLAGGASAATDPVGKVVDLLNGLKTKIEKDGAAEQKVYDKFACWCEKTTSTKASAIETAKQSIETLSNRVLSLKGKTANYKADIAQLNKDMAANEEGQKEATSIRETESKEYDGARMNLEQAIGALEHAIKVLEGAGELQVGSASLRKANLISTAAEVDGALTEAFKGPIGVTWSSQSDKQLIEDFVRNPSSFYGPHARKISGLQVKGNFGDYSPGSTAIQGILKGMYDAMVADLETKNAEEATSQKNYEELTATKTEELETMRKTLTSKEETYGDDTKTLANSVLERDETQTQLRDDEAFFVSSRDTCKNKADEWAERTRLRTEEKAGVTKAIEILSGDEAKETFGRSMGMLLQSDQQSVLAKEHQRKAFKALARVARDHHSLRLASLAGLLQTSSRAEFPVVIEAIDKMLAELRQEEMDDITLRDYCQAEEVKVEGEMEDLDHRMEEMEGLISRLKAKKKELSEDIQATENDISATQDAMAEALTNRQEESEQFKAALKDDLDAAALLGSAIDALSEFSKNNKLPLGLAQRGAKGHKDLKAHREPEYDDSGAPPDTFDEPYGGRANEGGNIVSILGYLKEDIENDVIQAKNAEAKAQQEFEDQRDAATNVIRALDAKKSSLEEQKAEADGEKADTEVLHDGSDKMKNGKKDYRESLKPKCDWMKEAFQTRREKRQQEMNGIMQAKASISGAGQSEEEEEVLLQDRAFLQKRR